MDIRHFSSKKEKNPSPSLLEKKKSSYFFPLFYFVIFHHHLFPHTLLHLPWSRSMNSLFWLNPSTPLTRPHRSCLPVLCGSVSIICSFS